MYNMYSKYNIVICRYKINTKFLLKHFNVYIMDSFGFSFVIPGFIHSCEIKLLRISKSKTVFTYSLTLLVSTSNIKREKIFTLPFKIRSESQAKVAAALIIDNYPI